MNALEQFYSKEAYLCAVAGPGANAHVRQCAFPTAWPLASLESLHKHGHHCVLTSVAMLVQ